jgi:N-acetylneuraminate lyase
MNLAGVFPAIVTPFDEQERVDEGMLCGLLDFLGTAGVHGVFAMGGTGEGVLMRTEERKRAAGIILRHRPPGLSVIVHVGALSTEEVCELAEHAASVGADVVAALPHFYFPIRDSDLVGFYRDVAAAAGIPVIGYHIPVQTHVQLTADLMERMADIENLVGLKFSDSDLFLMRNILDIGPGRFRILSGYDEMFVPALSIGAHGGIGTSYNFMPKVYVRIYDAMQRGDLATARELQIRANRVIRAIWPFPSIAASKAIMGFLGVPCGRCRRPLGRLSDEEVRALRGAAEKAGLFDLQ